MSRFPHRHPYLPESTTITNGACCSSHHVHDFSTTSSHNHRPSSSSGNRLVVKNHYCASHNRMCNKHVCEMMNYKTESRWIGSMRRHQKQPTINNVAVDNVPAVSFRTTQFTTRFITSNAPPTANGDWEWLIGEESWVFVNDKTPAPFEIVDRSSFTNQSIAHEEISTNSAATGRNPTEKACYSHSPPDMTLAVYNWKRHQLTFATQLDTLVKRMQKIYDDRHAGSSSNCFVPY